MQPQISEEWNSESEAEIGHLNVSQLNPGQRNAVDIFLAAIDVVEGTAPDQGGASFLMVQEAQVMYTFSLIIIVFVQWP